MLKGAALSVALSLSGAALAQAPVYDVGDSAQRSAASSSSNRTMEQRITYLERMVDSRTEMQHRLQQQLDTMQGEIDELRGAVEVHTNQLEKVLQRQRELYLEIDKRVEALKQAAGQSQSGSSDSASATRQGSASQSPAQSQQRDSQSGQSSQSAGSGQSESDAYDNAVNLILKSREYDKAIPAFQSFIQQFPDSQYAANAHYWLGQLLFNKQKWADAKEQFNVVANRFTDSSKRAEALLKLGIIEQRQGNNGQAKSFFNQVIADYPNSSARKLAEARMGSL